MAGAPPPPYGHPYQMLDEYPATPLPNPTSPPTSQPSTAQQQAQQHAQQQMIQTFWNTQMHQLETLDIDFKNHPLPLARIKKVMKTDQDVKMISAEAPLVFSKACEIFIAELTMRAWLHAEENKRRTLQRSDIANAVQDSDQYDFLIDIVPREDFTKKRREEFGGWVQGVYGAGPPGGPATPHPAPPGAPGPSSGSVDPNAYYNQIPQYTMTSPGAYQTPPTSGQPQPAPQPPLPPGAPTPQEYGVQDNGVME